ncbi:hypothetical protein GP486_004169 [Trichoglossum hirsutum]|uniref:Uncharacterized protein n=1 Tax=Trichoglossum hirsutum TaxID=265104 RepID=A0A9P8LBL3_9PEZI|nr:hypothetical protein GP486_004169 [Trichoglossum hirsutum]
MFHVLCFPHDPGKVNMATSDRASYHQNEDTEKPKPKPAPNTDEESGEYHTKPGPICGCLEFVWKKEIPLVVWFVLTFSCIAGSILLVKLRDGKGGFTNKYFKSINPTAILNVISGIYGFCLALALSNATTISWWRDVARGTKTGKLSEIWDAGNIGILGLFQFQPRKYKSWEASMLAIIAFVIAVTKTFGGPLLQQSLDVQTEDRFTNRTVKMDISKRIPPGWSGTIDASKPGNISLDPNFLSVMQTWYWGFPITTKPYADYFCPGVCTGNVEAAGIVWNHSTSSESLILQDQYGNGSVAFATSFDRFENEWGIPTLRVLAKYVTLVNNSCGATVTIDTYNISMAVTEYPVIIHNDTITLNTTLLQTSNSHLTPLKSDGDFVSSKLDVGAGPLAALHGFGNEYFESNATINYNVTTGQYDMITKGMLAKLYYDTNDTHYDTHGLRCARQFKSPTGDILTALQKVLFLVALRANNGSTTNFTVQQAVKAPIYRVKNDILWSAFGLMTISAVILIFPIWGVILSDPDVPRPKGEPLITNQHLRDLLEEDISMDPIRIARAFYHIPVKEAGFKTGVVQYTPGGMVMQEPPALPASEEGRISVSRPYSPI